MLGSGALINFLGSIMRGDSIVVEPHHRSAAQGILKLVGPSIRSSDSRYVITIAGESGSGKSELATALAELLEEGDMACAILQQDDYFVYPPRSNDRARRDDISWVGPQEVRLDLMNQHLRAFLDGVDRVVKPLVIYDTDSIESETLDFGGARVAVAEGTYTSLLECINTRVFIDRSYLDTRKHRERRMRDQSELDPFIDKVLAIEHGIISQHKDRADIIIHSDYSVTAASTPSI
jgi:uridine kinase